MKTNCFIFHNWNKWEIIREANILDDKKVKVGEAVIQRRTCERCGKIEMDIIKTY